MTAAAAPRRYSAGCAGSVSNPHFEFEGSNPYNRLRLILAEREGFEPSIRGYRIHTFQACAFDRSAISPNNPLRQDAVFRSIGGGASRHCIDPSLAS